MYIFNTCVLSQKKFAVHISPWCFWRALYMFLQHLLLLDMSTVSLLYVRRPGQIYKLVQRHVSEFDQRVTLTVYLVWSLVNLPEIVGNNHTIIKYCIIRTHKNSWNDLRSLYTSLIIIVMCKRVYRHRCTVKVSNIMRKMDGFSAHSAHCFVHRAYLTYYYSLPVMLRRITI